MKGSWESTYLWHDCHADKAVSASGAALRMIRATFEAVRFGSRCSVCRCSHAVALAVISQSVACSQTIGSSSGWRAGY